jgi:two-component system chemotaxis sensor kinase CheA
MMNKGTAITLKIPLTLAIIGGMTISSGSQEFIIPTLSIKETFIPKKENIIREPGGNELIMLRGECYPIIRLHKLFNISDSVSELEKGKIVLLDADNKTACLFIDEIMEDQQIVFKPVPDFILNSFGSISGVSGCTILGDGIVRLVLDVNTLVHM